MPSGDLTSKILSGSTNGKPINVAATATAGDVIHVGPAGSTDYDLVTLYAHNIHTATVALSLEWGSTTAAELLVTDLRPNSGPVLIADRIPIRGGLTIAAFADTTAVVNITGRAMHYEAPS